MKIYTMEKHNGGWAIWETTINKHSGGVRGVFKGNKEECKQYAKNNHIRLKRASLSR